ncbi:RING-H2 finger protein ATL1 [Striga hermonthica]|uniref:RING-type E3 ubiquitin transferase n=1 Tax=Striga hermonthica TaxID=68872 RepID=A0A9N7N465_STRHE|nr:RING-H2 finger protein ATL1 [Striga hermonthica]
MSTLQNLQSQSQSLPPISSHCSFSGQPPPPAAHGSDFPMLAVAVLGITATAFLLVAYYIFVTNCCFRWQPADPLSRRRLPTLRRAPPVSHEPLTSPSPSRPNRGLDELLIRNIPTVRYTPHQQPELFTNSSKCVVCLNEFRNQETLRVLPKCGHAFHVDCIDIWLVSSSSCPLCRSAISGRNRYHQAQPETIVAPTSSPQDFHPDDDLLEIVISSPQEGTGGGGLLGEPGSGRFLVSSSSKQRKLLRGVSVMGDEGIDVRAKDGVVVEPIRRSFSMDSATDPRVYLSIQEILRESREIGPASGSRSRRSIFSFGHGRGARSAVLPV